MELTAKQETFAQAIADGMNQSAAYRRAYNTGKMLPATITNNAHILLQRSDVSARVGDLKEAVAKELLANRVWDATRFIEESEINLQGARSDGQWAPANGALSLIGKATGLLTDKVDISVTHTLKPGLSLEELEAREVRLTALEARIVEGRVVALEEEGPG